jgi:GTPase SAR1 family protein
MNVIIIGNKSVGKTSMVITLAKGTENVQVIPSGPGGKIATLSNDSIETLAGTSQKEEESLLLRINLPSGPEREVRVRWIDTPGEAWSKPAWQQSNPEKYQDLVHTLGQSQAVLLLLPPYRYRSRTQEIEDTPEFEEILDPETWKKQLKERLTLLRSHCPSVQHILISIHKADLFHNLEEEKNTWQYNTNASFLWGKHDTHIRETYFSLADDIIREHNSQPPYLNPKFFVTTIHYPTLLELPWVYLGVYFANA